MHPADDEIFSTAQLESWREARHAEFCLGSGGTSAIRHSKPSAQGSGRYLYRPRQVLVEAVESQESTQIANELNRRGGIPAEEVNSHFDEVNLPVRSFAMPDEVDIQDLVTEFRQREDDHARLNIAPNHVFSGEQIYHGGPSGEPRSAEKFAEPAMSPDAPAPTIAVLDTGYDPNALELHQGLAERLDIQGCVAEDALSNGFLAVEGGHGTFIDGIIMRVAPQARIRQVGVLTPAGLTDDQTVALELARAARAGIQVINLSLGGYTSHDEPPLAMALTLTHLPEDVAIVAAAGNNSSERPFWPGAFKRVVSVGALDTRSGENQDGEKRASFSNHGWWVDVYAPGVRICSTYLDATWKLPSETTQRVMDGYAYWSGTSFAAPQVAAMIANQIPAAGSARQAVLQVLAQARWVPGLGPVLIPQPRVD
jgi:hypothetical protein